MKSQSAKTALAVVGVIGIALAFWMLLLAPKREKADELSKQTAQLSAEVATEQQRAEIGREAKENFPANYAQLVLLGKAVPAEAATPSLLVQLNGVSARAKTSFQSIALASSGGDSASSASVEATESAAALQPLGASVGPAGLSAMPYDLEFAGGYFDIADFLEGLDAFVTTSPDQVVAKGRLVTIDGFNLTPRGEGGSALTGDFSVTTYVTPPGQGLTAGASPSGPGAATTSTTTP